MRVGFNREPRASTRKVCAICGKLTGFDLPLLVVEWAQEPNPHGLKRDHVEPICCQCVAEGEEAISLRIGLLIACLEEEVRRLREEVVEGCEIDEDATQWVAHRQEQKND